MNISAVDFLFALTLVCIDAAMIALVLFFVAERGCQKRKPKPPQPPIAPEPPDIQKAELAWDAAERQFRLDMAALEAHRLMDELARQNQTEFTIRNCPQDDPAYRDIEFVDGSSP